MSTTTAAPNKRRSVLDLMASPAMGRETAQQTDAFRPEGIRIMALYVRYMAPKKETMPPKHVVIPFALDMLPVSETIDVDGKSWPVYEHVSKDRLVLRLNIARKGQGKGAKALLVHNPGYLTEGELCYVSSFKKITAEPMDIVELGNVGLSCSDKYPVPSIQMDSSRTIPTSELGITMADRVLAIYRKQTRFVPSIVSLASKRGIRQLFPRRDKDETDSSNDPWTRDYLNTFPLPLVSLPGIEPNKDGTLDIVLKRLPSYEAIGWRDKSFMQARLPRAPEFVNEAHKDNTGNLVPAEAQVYAEAYVGQERNAESGGEAFHVKHGRAYASNIFGAPSLYPTEFEALMRCHPGFPMSVVTSIDLRETLNDTINYGNESMRGEIPDGELKVKFEAVVLNTDRALLELAIPCTLSLVQERFGGANVLTSVPYVQEDRAAVYEARKGRAALKAAFTDPKEDKVLALDAASLPLGDEKTMLYFAFALKPELKGAEDIEDVSALAPSAGDAFIRNNQKKIKEPAKATGLDKIHGPWMQGDGKRQIPIFAFFTMERAYAEKLRATANKPLETTAFYTPPTDPALIASDAVGTIEEFRLTHYTQLAKTANGGQDDEEDEEVGGDAMDEAAAHGTKRPLEQQQQADADEPDLKKQRTSVMHEIDDEKTRSGFEDDVPQPSQQQQDAVMDDADFDE